MFVFAKTMIKVEYTFASHLKSQNNSHLLDLLDHLHQSYLFHVFVFLSHHQSLSNTLPTHEITFTFIFIHFEETVG